MIDPLTETVISLSDAARNCPTRRRGKRPHLSCLYRWTKSGCKGVLLEWIQIGGTRCTSREAMVRFFGRLTALADAGNPVTHQQNRDDARYRAAEAELDSDGI